MAAVLPNFYSKVAAADLDPTLASSYWGYTNTLAMGLVAIFAPVLGAISDQQGHRKKFLATFASLGIFFTALLYFIQSGDWLWASVFYVAARIGFSGADIFYNALLPTVAPEKRLDQVSVLGYALGYLGGGLLLAINLHMIMNPSVWALPDGMVAARVSFLTVSLWWGIFSIPLFLFVREPIPAYRPPVVRMNPVSSGFKRVLKTLKEIKKYEELFKFLLAYWFYNDGIGTIIIMAVIFGTEIGITQSNLIGAILLVQFVGIPFSLLFGKIAEKWGARNGIIIGLVVYSFICVGGYFMRSAFDFWMLALGVSMVQGGTQALSRSLFASMTPPEKIAEFFGFYDVSSKFSGILGPAIFGLVGQFTGNSRWSIFALIVFFLGGIYLLLRVNVRKGRELASQASK